jgi:HEAT repeat protein
MPAGKPPSDSVLARAAELRAGGASWEAVAARLNRSAESVGKWPGQHPDRWQAALRAAERRLAIEATAEAVLILRQLLRSEDEKVRRDAAKALIDLRLELARHEPKPASDPPAPPVTSEARQVLAFLEGHTDEELARLAAELYPPVPGPGVESDPEAGGREV